MIFPEIFVHNTDRLETQKAVGTICDINLLSQSADCRKAITSVAHLEAGKDMAKQEKAKDAPQRHAVIVQAGGIEALSLPSEFGQANRGQLGQLEFLAHGSQSTKVVYRKLDNYIPCQSTQALFNELLDKPPHELTDKETEDIAEAVPNGYDGTNGNFTIISLRTQNLAGKTVLVMETGSNDCDRHSLNIFANPDHKQTSLEVIWFEAPEKQYKRYAKDVSSSLEAIRWR